MSTEKGLVGTTAEELHAQVCRERGWHWEWTKRDLQVALAAQRAMAEWLYDRAYISSSVYTELCAKLGVK